MSRTKFNIDIQPVNGNGSFSCTVTDDDGQPVGDPVKVTQGDITGPAARLAALMPPATASDVEAKLVEALGEGIEPMKAGRLLADFPELRPPVLHGYLRETEVGNLIATSKAGKTFLALDLAISVVIHRMWLGFIQVEPGPVLYVDAELHRNTYARRLAAVAKAMGILSDEFADGLEVLSLRGRRMDIYQLGRWLKHRYAPGTHRLIILDALYRLIPPGVDENSNSEMTAIYNELDRIAEQQKAAIVVVHHASKGTQGHKGKTDVGAGAGAQSRAVDSHVILRDHEEEGCVVMEASCRSWPSPPPAVLRWGYPVWTHEPDLDPDDLLMEGRRRKKKVEAEPVTWTPERLVEQYVTTTPKPKSVIVASAGIDLKSKRLASDLLTMAEAKKLIYRWIDPDDKRAIHYATKAQPKGGATK